MPDFQYDRKRFVEPVSLDSLSQATRRNEYEVGTKTTVVAVPPVDGGPVVIGPGGTLIKPPVIPGNSTFPIARIQPPFTIEVNSEWAILNGTQFGWFANSLVTSSGVLNLDNTTQSLYSVSLGTAFLASVSGPRVRDGVLWNGGRYWDGSAFVVPTAFSASTLDGVPATIDGVTLDRALSLVNNSSGVWSDETYVYGVAEFSGAAYGQYAFRIAHVGPFALEIVSTRLGGSTSLYNRVQGVENGLLVLTAPSGAFPARFVDMVTGAFATPSTPVSVTNVFERSAFVLTDGSVAGLYVQESSGLTVTYGLLRVDRFGVSTIQSDFLVSESRQPQSVHFGVPHKNSGLVVMQLYVGGQTQLSVIQMSTAGWAEYPLPSTGQLAAQFLRWAPGFEGTVLRWADVTSIYEGSVA